MSNDGGSLSRGELDLQADAVSDLATEFGLLSNKRRLTALLCLRDGRSSMKLSELVDEVAARECDAEPESIPEAIRGRVGQSLYHVHVPKLRAAGVVRYDEIRETISLTEDARSIESIMDAVFED